MLTLPWHDQPSRYFSRAWPAWKWGWNCCCGCSEVGYYYTGYDSGATRTNDGQKYESTDTYTTITDCPTPVRGGVMGTAISGKAYAFGGTDSPGSFVRDNDEYTPAGDSWSSKTDLATPQRAHGGAGTLGDYGYYFYGQNSTISYNLDTDRYDPSGDSWAAKSNAPSTTRLSVRYGETADRLVSACGNASAGGGLRDTETYQEDGWTSESDSPTPERGANVRGMDAGSGFGCVGGASGSGAMRDHDVCNPGSSWVSKTDCPTPARYFNAGFTICDVGYSIGNGSGVTADNDSWVDDVWSAETDQPATQYWCASCAL